MITIKNKASIQKMMHAGQLLSQLFQELGAQLVPGKSTAEVDAWIEREIVGRGLVSKMKGYMGYRHVSCISLNDEVVHGVPSATQILANKDLVKVDVCVSWRGYCADMARAFFVGQQPAKEDKIAQLVAVAERALQKGIEQAQPGNKLSDISAAIQQEIDAHGFGILRDFAGHGIGKQMHEEPEILNYGKPGKGPVIQPGMAFAIEPMITAGGHEVYITDDGWTVKTKDKSMAAHVEDTVVITNNGPQIITRAL